MLWSPWETARGWNKAKQSEAMDEIPTKEGRRQRMFQSTTSGCSLLNQPFGKGRQNIVQLALHELVNMTNWLSLINLIELINGFRSISLPTNCRHRKSFTDKHNGVALGHQSIKRFYQNVDNKPIQIYFELRAVKEGFNRNQYRGMINRVRQQKRR